MDRSTPEVLKPTHHRSEPSFDLLVADGAALVTPRLGRKPRIVTGFGYDVPRSTPDVWPSRPIAWLSLVASGVYSVGMPLSAPTMKTHDLQFDPLVAALFPCLRPSAARLAGARS